MKKVLALSLASLSTLSIADDIVINATKINKQASTITQSVSVITEDEIEEQGFTNVTEILRQHSGIEFKKVNGPGHYAYIKMRGFSTGHILLVIDGMTVTNNGAPDGIGAIINQMAPESIERIEILRGPQATLYGANSTAGVISITTKSGASAEPELNVGIEAGSLDWKKSSVSLRNSHDAANGKFHYSVNASKTDSDGIIEDEFFKDTSSQLKAGYTDKQIDVGISYWKTDNRFGYAELIEPYDERTRQNIYGFQLPDPNQFSATESETASAFITQSINDSISHKLQFSQTESERYNEDFSDGILGLIFSPEDGFYQGGTVYNAGVAVEVRDRAPASASSGLASASTFTEESRQIGYNLIYKKDALNAVTGVEDHRSEAKNSALYLAEPTEADLDYRSVFINGEYSLNTTGITLAAGLRRDNYDSWDNKSIGSIGINISLNDLSLFANYGTSYKVPKLREAKGTYGSDTLLPESGKTGEVGVRQQAMQGRLAWDATLWHTELDEVIFFDSSIENSNARNGFGQYNNGSKQLTKGVELSLAFSFTPDLALQTNYTYTDSHQKAQGSSIWQRTVQIARNNGNVGLFYTDEKLTAGMNAYYSGPRLRWNGDVEMKSYLRFDVSAKYRFSDQLNVFTRIENLLGTEIEEGLGYEPLGVYAIVGLDVYFF